MQDKADGPTKYIIRMTSNHTSADFLFVPLRQKRNRMHRTFKTSVRLFLGVPVTSATCHIGKCKGKAICTNGDHAFHATARVTTRHHAVKNAIGHVLQRLHFIGQCDYSCHFETKMSTLNIPKRVDAKDRKTDAQVDFYLSNPATNHMFFTDVMVTHPSQRDEENQDDSKAAVNKGVVTKYSKYLDNYVISKDDVIPLIFDTYGGYADVTYRFLQRMADTIGGSEPKLRAKVLRTFRDRIAVALHTSHAEVINWINGRNIRMISNRR